MLRLDPTETTFSKNKFKNEDEKSCLIILFGDSRISEWNPRPSLSNWSFINLGINGQTTEQIKMRLESDVLSHSPDFVILQAGINDLKTIGLFPMHKDLIIRKCLDNLTYIAEEISRKDIQVVLLSILPTGRPDLIRSFLWSDDINPSIKIVNDNLKKLESDKIKFIDLDKIFLDNSYIHSKYKKDMLHLNKAGYQQMNRYLQPILKEIINK